MAGLGVDSFGRAPLQHIFRLRQPEFPVFVPAGIAKIDVVSRIFEDIDPNEPDPSTMSSVAPLPGNRRDTQIFSTSFAKRLTSQPDQSVDKVAII